ncbi:MAG: hypothetical protein H6739_14080 [Alphaproteobacteria bacterium]|nr:hypothetical protein [Alphaproteobacteria bacterium]
MLAEIFGTLISTQGVSPRRLARWLSRVERPQERFFVQRALRMAGLEEVPPPVELSPEVSLSTPWRWA